MNSILPVAKLETLWDPDRYSQAQIDEALAFCDFLGPWAHHGMILTAEPVALPPYEGELPYGD